jgi:hypothetical protein
MILVKVKNIRYTVHNQLIISYKRSFVLLLEDVDIRNKFGPDFPSMRCKVFRYSNIVIIWLIAAACFGLSDLAVFL